MKNSHLPTLTVAETGLFQKTKVQGILSILPRIYLVDILEFLNSVLPLVGARYDCFAPMYIPLNQQSRNKILTGGCTPLPTQPPPPCGEKPFLL